MGYRGIAKNMLAVNIPSEFFGQTNFPVKISQILCEADVFSDSLKLELTESALMKDVATTINVMNALKEMGVHLSIDDFGTGYSSLSYLRHFPIDHLKIDKSFIDDLTNNADDKAIVKAIISLAKSLKLVTIAEGVETREQLDFLRAEGCDVIQGYYFSKPIPANELTRLLREDKGLET